TNPLHHQESIMRTSITATFRTIALVGAVTTLLTGTTVASMAADETGRRPAVPAPEAHHQEKQSGRQTGKEPWKSSGVLAGVRGKAQIFFNYSPEDTIRFGVDAQAAPFTRPIPQAGTGLPTDARGTLTISHYVKATGGTMTAIADVDCLVTGGRTATLTAIVRASGAEPKGKRLGISIQQGENGRPDRLGFGWGVANVDGREDGGTGTCMAPAPFAPVVSGGYRVTHAELPLPSEK
ncbi:hypothetical protein, partial [Streptomyces clavuligerus]